MTISYENLNLVCEWCMTKSKHKVGTNGEGHKKVSDQPKCPNCFRFIAKRREQ
jgi:hypothetical protein